MERLLTVKEVAEKFRVTPTCVYRWLSQDRLPVIRLSRRCVRFRETDVSALLDKLRGQGIKEPLPTRFR
jgi:excisionase family DNA binding protein